MTIWLAFLIYFAIGALICYFTREGNLNKVLEERPDFPPALVMGVITVFWCPFIAHNIY